MAKPSCQGLGNVVLQLNIRILSSNSGFLLLRKKGSGYRGPLEISTILSNEIPEATIHLIPIPKKDIIKKEKLQAKIKFINRVAKILKENPAVGLSK